MLLLVWVLLKVVAVRLLALSAIPLGFGGRRWRRAGRSSFLEDAVHKRVGILGVQAPKAAFSRLILAPRHFKEALVEGQVMADGILMREREIFS